VEGKRLAGAHLIFNVTTGVVAIVFINQFLWGVESISAAVGIGATDYTMKLAVFHTLFNLAGVMLMSPLIGRLARFLEKSLRAKETTAVEPKYLNDAVLEFPDATMEAVRKETLHLYDNALELIAHGVDLHREEIFSDTDLEQVVSEKRKVIQVDIDKVYERNVKVLYGAIVAFISEAQSKITSEYSEDLYAMRTAGRHIVESVKDIKHLNKNLAVFAVSENDHIRGEYNQFRLQIGTILRELGGLREEALGPENMGLLNLDGLIAGAEEGDVVSNGSLDRLIRKGLITPEMATSVMNDSAYTYDVSMKLIEMGGILFAARAMDLREAQQSMQLDDKEMDDVIDEINTEKKVSHIDFAKMKTAETG
jgi:phosphate:Na+ symporter